MANPAESAAAGPGLHEVAEQTTAVVRGSVRLDGLRAFFDSSFGLLPRIVAGQGAEIRGPAFCLYRTAAGAPDPAAAQHLEVGFAVDRILVPQEGVTPGHLPAGEAARLVHAGGYEGLGAAWERLGGWIAAQGRQTAGVRWEVYLTKPGPDADPAAMRTELNWLLVS